MKQVFFFFCSFALVVAAVPSLRIRLGGPVSTSCCLGDCLVFWPWEGWVGWWWDLAGEEDGGRDGMESRDGGMGAWVGGYGLVVVNTRYLYANYGYNVLAPRFCAGYICLPVLVSRAYRRCVYAYWLVSSARGTP